MKRTFRYLKGTTQYSLSYRGVDLELIDYINADWTSNLKHRKSTSTYVFLVNGSAISWASKKQTCIVLSTMEEKLVATASVVQECIWLRYFLHHLGVTTLSVKLAT